MLQTELLQEKTEREQALKEVSCTLEKYVVEETTGALDHIKGDAIYEVELTYGIEQNNPFVIYMLDASNVLMRPAFSVAKIADKTTNEEGKAVLFDEKTGRYIEKKQARNI